MKVGNSKGNVSGLINQLSGVKLDGVSMGRSLSPPNLIQSAERATKASRIKNFGGTTALSFSAKSMTSGINFGKPSSTRTAVSNSGSAWTTLLKQTASGGFASALGGGLGSIGGIGSLISGILGLFGNENSKNPPPPLVEFQLPASQQQTVYVGSKVGAANQGSAETTLPTSASGIHNGRANTALPGAYALQYRSSEIAQAVKTALLTSSSLNDVIADI